MELAHNTPYPLEALSVWCGLTVDEVREALNCMVNTTLLEPVTECNVTILRFKNWEKRQRSDSYERVMRFRKKGVTECNVTETLQVTPTVTTEVEVDVEVDLDKDKIKPNVTRTRNVRFTIPTVEEVAEYCQARGNSVDPEKFHAFYTSNGWRVGKNPMKNWKAAVVSTWEKG